jgi:hypothetical protein
MRWDGHEWVAGAGAQGPPGEPGTPGTPGTPGAAGADGRTILSGTSNPTTTVPAGQQPGDFFLNTSTTTLFGPRTTTWPAGVPLIGPAGGAGPRGSAVLSGTADPTPTVPAGQLPGDFYINTATSTLFGPRTATAWPAGVSLIGPQGPPGGNGGSGGGGAGSELVRASDVGLAAWTFNPFLSPGAGYSWGAGTLDAALVRIDQQSQVTGVMVAAAAALSGLTGAWAGIYNAAGIVAGPDTALLASTGDVSTQLNGTAAGSHATLALTAPVTLQPGLYRVGLLNVGAGINLRHAVVAGFINVINVTGAAGRQAIYRSGQSSLPASLAPGAAGTFSVEAMLWCVLQGSPVS